MAVTPSATRSWTMSHSSRRDTGSTPKVGSSSSSSSGSWTSAQESPSFCFMPPESWPARRSWNGPRPEKAKSRSRRAAQLAARHAVEVGVEGEVLAHREVGVEAEALRHVGEVALHRLGLPRHARRGAGVAVRATADPGVAGARPQHAGEHAQGGRLAGAVGADEAEQLAAPRPSNDSSATATRSPKRRVRPSTRTIGSAPTASAVQPPCRGNSRISTSTGSPGLSS